MSFKEWKKVKLGDLVDEERGISYGIVQPGEFLKEGGVPILKVNNLTEGKVLLKDVYKVTSEVESKFVRSRLTGNEILISLVGSLGHILKISKEQVGWNVVRAIGVLPIKKELNRDFIYWALKQPEVQINFINHATHTVQATLNLKELREIQITIPSPKIQKQIATILSSLDDKIELNRQTNQTLEAIAQTLFKEMCVPKSKVLSRGWEIFKLGDILEAKGGTTPSTKNEDFWNGEFHWATPKDLSNLSTPILLTTERKITQKGLKQISSGLSPKGTLLMSSRAPIGYFALSQVPVAINQGFIAVNGTKVSNLFLLHWMKLNLEKIKSMGNGSTFLEISKTVFRLIEIIIPSDKILKKFEDLINPIFEKIISNEQEIQTLKNFRDSLLPKLMKGEIKF